MLKISRRFFQSGKISYVFKIDEYMVPRFNVWSLHRWMLPSLPTLIWGQVEHNQFSIKETSVSIVSVHFWYLIGYVLLYKLCTVCGLSIYSWIHFRRYDISEILSFSNFSFFMDNISCKKTYHVRFEKRPRFLNECSITLRNVIRGVYVSILCSDDPAILSASHCFADMLCVPKDFSTPLVLR